VEVSIDWVRVTGPGCTKDQAARVLERHFGELVETRRGQFFRRASWRYALGVGLHFGENSKAGHVVPDDQTHYTVEVPGQACRALGTPGVVELLRDLALLGCRATRIDGAIDYHQGIGSHLLQAMYDAQNNGEIIRKPKWRWIESEPRPGVKACTAELGSRQSRYKGRCYDKGLEQSPMTAHQGQWVRFEVEHTSEGCAAQQYMMDILRAKPGQVERAIAGGVLGAFDFRERSPYDNDRHVRHRPRLAWFVEMVEMFGRTVTTFTRRVPTFEGTRRHLVHAVRALNSIADAIGGKLEDAAQLLGSGVEGRAFRRSGSGLDAMLFEIQRRAIVQAT